MLRRNPQAEARGHCHQVRKRVGLHLAHDLTSVRLDGDLADAEFAADLFVQQPGNVTSSTRQQGTAGWGRHRNSCAEANVSARHPAVRSNCSSDSRTETSSSTTKTIDVTSCMGRTWIEREAVGEGTVYGACVTSHVLFVAMATSSVMLC